MRGSRAGEKRTKCRIRIVEKYLLNPSSKSLRFSQPVTVRFWIGNEKEEILVRGISGNGSRNKTNAVDQSRKELLNLKNNIRGR